jgi:hypothetical protein
VPLILTYRRPAEVFELAYDLRPGECTARWEKSTWVIWICAPHGGGSSLTSVPVNIDAWAAELFSSAAIAPAGGDWWYLPEMGVAVRGVPHPAPWL